MSKPNLNLNLKLNLNQTYYHLRVSKKKKKEITSQWKQKSAFRRLNPHLS